MSVNCLKPTCRYWPTLELSEPSSSCVWLKSRSPVSAGRKEVHVDRSLGLLPAAIRQTFDSTEVDSGRWKHPSHLDARWKPKSPGGIELFSDRLSGPSPKRQPTRVCANTRLRRSGCVCRLPRSQLPKWHRSQRFADDSPTSWEMFVSASVDSGQGPDVDTGSSSSARLGVWPTKVPTTEVAEPSKVAHLRWVASTADDSPTEVGASTTR